MGRFELEPEFVRTRNGDVIPANAQGGGRSVIYRTTEIADAPDITNTRKSIGQIMARTQLPGLVDGTKSKRFRSTKLAE